MQMIVDNNNSVLLQSSNEAMQTTSLYDIPIVTNQHAIVNIHHFVPQDEGSKVPESLSSVDKFQLS